jgi:hypothetical protein
MYALSENEQTDNDARLVMVLDADHLLKAQRHHYGRRQLSAGALAAMWGLRIYAILMVIVVSYSIVQAIHPGS